MKKKRKLKAVAKHLNITVFPILMVQTQNQTIEYRECRERWGSPYHERRRMYLTLVPSDTSSVEAAERSLLAASDTLSRIIELWTPSSLDDRVPWWPYGCTFCERVRKYEEERGIEKWKRRGLCFRHYALHHFVELQFEYHGSTNGCKGSFVASPDMIMVEDFSGKYHYVVYIYKDYAKLEVVAPRGNYTFMYKNHKNAPNGYLSSYEYLLRNVLYRLFLKSVDLREMSYWRDFVLIINDVLELPPKYEEGNPEETEIYAKRAYDEFEYIRRVGRHIFGNPQ